jgi:ATP-dependent protease HslVU (ClpYQ) peptidase subunit
MSVVIGIKKDGIIYLGADTQVTYGNYSRHYDHEDDHKMFIEKDLGLLIGFVGTAKQSYILKKMLPQFTSLKDGKLTKDKLRQELLDPFIQALKDYDLLQMSDGHHDTQIHMLVAKDDMLFQIESDGNILNHLHFSAIGSGSSVTIPYLKYGGGDVKETLLNALRISARMDQYVSGPFLLANTKTLVLEGVTS